MKPPVDSGVYGIFNLLTGTVYVGSSVDLKKRIQTHRRLLFAGRHHNPYLARAVELYGIDNFAVVILKECERSVLLESEQFYLVHFQDKYNLSLSASAPMSGRKHSEKTKKLFRLRPVKRGKDSHNYGKKLSEEQRFKLSQSRIGSKRTLETKTKMSDTAKRISAWIRMKPFIEKQMCPIVDSQGNQFRSLAEAAKFWGVSVSTVCDILKGRHTKTRKKISFRYLEVA